MKKVGVVGLGNMGKGMAMSLKRGGYDVLGYDASPNTRTALEAEGLEVASSLSQIIQNVELLILSLPTSDIVEQVVFGEDGILNHAKPGLIVVDTTTADPNSTRKVAKALADVNVRLVDGPVSGGPKGAASGTMGMVLGGDRDVIETIEPVLAAMSGVRVHVGPTGAGHAAKLINNLMTGAHMLIAGEAVRIATAAGLDPQRIFEGINAGSGQSKVTSHFFPTWIWNDAFDSGFTMKLMRKDLRLAMALLKETQASAPLATEAGRLWAKSAESVDDHEDFNRIVQFIAK